MTIRRRLGDLKFELLDRLPYAPLRRRAHRLLPRVARLAERLPALPGPVPPWPPACELHMLCGARQSGLGLLAAWSLLRFLPGALLYVHSDGSFGPEEVERWGRVLAGCRLIARKQADELAAEALGPRYPRLLRWRSGNLYGAQLVDYHLFGSSPVVLSWDSDVLCFSRPEELLQGIAGRQGGLRWNRDLATCYSQSPQLLGRILGAEVPAALNAGLLLVPRLGEEAFAYLETALRRLEEDGRIELDHLWSAQTYYALWAARLPGSGPLPPAYDVALGRTRPDAVARHYVNIPSIRPRLLTEGAARVLAQAGLSLLESP